jgi:hypothetical protein
VAARAFEKETILPVALPMALMLVFETGNASMD